MQDIRILASRDGRHPQYMPAANGRDAFVTQGPASCNELSEYGWCKQGPEWQQLPFDAGEIYMAQGSVSMGDETLLYCKLLVVPGARVRVFSPTMLH